MSVKTRITELNTRLAEKLTAKGVEADGTETTTALIDKVDSIQTGGGGEVFGENINVPNILNLLYAAESKTGVVGEFTILNPLPTGEHLILDTGLDSINGFFYADTTYPTDYVAKDASLFGWDIGNGGMVFCRSGNDSSWPTLFTRGSCRFDAGKLYVTPQYGGNAAYTPFYPAHRYKWIAW